MQTLHARPGSRAALTAGLVLAVLASACFRGVSSTTYTHGGGAAWTDSGPLRVHAEAHPVAGGRAMLFESRVSVKQDFQHRAALLVLASESLFYSLSPNVGIAGRNEDGRALEVAQSHADFTFDGSVHLPGSGLVHFPTAASHAPAATTGEDPNRITVQVPVDVAALGRAEPAPALRYRGESLAVPDGALFLVVMSPEGPQRPTRLSTALDLNEIEADPEGFVDRLFDEQPLLLELLEEQE
jgi:hypothetical protein